MHTRLLVISIVSALLVPMFFDSIVAAAPSMSAAPLPCPDFDGGGVDVGDITAVAADWKNPGFDSNHDLDKDGDVDIRDIVMAAMQLGTNCSGPSTIFGVALGEGNASREAMAKGAGVDWYRIIVSWENIEPNAPVGGVHTYKWGSYDNLISGLRQRGLTPIVEIRGIPTWARAAGSPWQNIDCGLMNSAGLQAYSEFLTAIVERSDGDNVGDIAGSPVVRYWEVGNEPDSMDTSGNHYGLCYGNYPNDYAQLLARSWDAVHGADSEAQVLFGGLAYEKCCNFNSDPQDQIAGPDFFDSVLNYIKNNPRTAGKGYFDVMNVHAYSSFMVFYNPPDVRTKYQIVRNKLANCVCGLDAVPLMNTEGGRRSEAGQVAWGQPGSPERQARYVPQLFVRSLAADLDAVVWFAMMDVGAREYGLLKADNSEKQAYWAYETLSDELRGYTYDAVRTTGVSWPSPVEGHVFADGSGGEKWVVFIPPQNEGTTKIMSFPFSKIKVVDYDKFNSTYPDGNGDPSKTRILCSAGSVNVTITADPIYVQPNPPEPCP